MNRGRRLLLVSHCVLNQNSVVHPLARTGAGLAEVVGMTIRAGVGVVQLPCPEMAFGGLGRAPMTREEYDTPEFRHLCSELARNVIETLRPMLDDGCTVCGVLGIEGSPSCALDSPVGILMEELLRRNEFAGVARLAVPENYPDAANPDFLAGLERVLTSP